MNNLPENTIGPICCYPDLNDPLRDELSVTPAPFGDNKFIARDIEGSFVMDGTEVSFAIELLNSIKNEIIKIPEFYIIRQASFNNTCPYDLYAIVERVDGIGFSDVDSFQEWWKQNSDFLDLEKIFIDIANGAMTYHKNILQSGDGTYYYDDFDIEQFVVSTKGEVFFVDIDFYFDKLNRLKNSCGPIDSDFVYSFEEFVMQVYSDLELSIPSDLVSCILKLRKCVVWD